MKTLLSAFRRAFAANSYPCCRFTGVLFTVLGFAASAANGNDLTFTYSSAADVPVNASSYAASGTATLDLDFAPATGTTLTVVNNTGLGFISGAFANLAQGQELMLSHGGRNYVFVVNYFGGTGNDLVLLWANLRPLAWGSNVFGSLGDNSVTDSRVPVAVHQGGALAGKRVISVSTGYFHSLALCSDGTVAAWGYNVFGKLGNNSRTDSSVPVEVDRSGALAGKTVIAVAAGNSHSLALCSDGTLAAWGNNGAGQLGNNVPTDSLVPVAVAPNGALAGKTVVAVSAGSYFSLALCSDGTLAAWGDNSSGQLGNNSRDSSSVPVAVVRNGVLAGKTVTAVSAGSAHCLALCSDGKVASWGENYSGQLGNYQNQNYKSVPVAVIQNENLIGKTVVAVSAGNLHSLALCSDGSMAAWGNNDYGQLGENTTLSRVTPVPVIRIGALANKDVAAISAGEYVNLVQCWDSTLAAWGNNFYGQFGISPSTSNGRVPVAAATTGVTTGERFFIATTGHDSRHVLALVASPALPPAIDNIKATGVSAGAAVLNAAINANNSSTAVSFEYGTTTAYGNLLAATPAQVNGGGATAVSATLAGLSPGTTYHFRVNGTNAVGVTGGVDHAFITSGTVKVKSESDVVATADNFSASGELNIELGFTPAVGAVLTVANNTGAGFIHGVFSNLAQGQLVTLGYGGLPYRFVVNYFGGTGNDLVLQWANVRPVAWSRNSNGQLGNGNKIASNVPVAVVQSGVLSGKTVIAVAVGTAHSVALCSDGTLAAWGDNTFGELGNNGTAASSVPVKVDQTGVLAGKTVVSVSAGYGHNLVLCSDGTLAAWGYGNYGQLGTGGTSNRRTPVVVNQSGVLAGKTVVSATVGADFCLAVCSDGTLATWGYNFYGQLGNNSISSAYVPTAVVQNGALAGKTAIAVAAGRNHCLVLCSDGTLAAWGDNSSGQLATLGNYSTVPVTVSRNGALSGKKVTAVSAGGFHCLAQCSDGSLAAWGNNDYGQLGNNSTSNSSVPVAVSQSGLLADKTVGSVSGGYYHSLALCRNGTVAAWGINSQGELGNNSTTNSPVPVAVTTTGLAVGERFVLANSSEATGTGLGLVASPEPKPASITVSSGSAQRAEVNTAFGSPLVVLVKDQAQKPMGGVTVTFGTPGSGAGGSFAGGVNTAVTDASGIAKSPVFSANTVAGGPYVVTSSAPGVAPISFSLSNAPAAATHLVISAPAQATAGVVLGITVTARDQFDNTATGFTGTVHFSSTDGAAILPEDYTFAGGDAGVHSFSGGVKLTKAGPQSLTVTDHVSPTISGIGTISVAAAAPAIMVATSGTSQVAKVNADFPLPLVATVHDAYGNPTNGISVTFTAPDSGANATFGANTTITVLTDSSGLANSGTLTAAAANGSYIVTATTPLVATPARFALGNGTVNPTPVMPATPPGGIQVTRQTGLYDVAVPVQNTTPLPINGFRLHVDLSSYLAAYPSLRLYNASSPGGSTDIYIDYPYPLAVDQVVSMKLSFYTKTRIFPNPFAPGLSVEMLTASQVSGTIGNGVQASLVSMQNGTVLLEFPAVPGRWYRVSYCSDMAHWLDCPRPVQATDTVMQWTDCGPPFTTVPPSATSSRLYRIHEIMAP